MTRLRLARHDEIVEAIETAVNPILAAINEGCFNPSDDPQGECADRDCCCCRVGRQIAVVALDALLEAAVRLELATTSTFAIIRPSLIFRMEASDDK